MNKAHPRSYGTFLKKLIFSNFQKKQTIKLGLLYSICLLAGLAVLVVPLPRVAYAANFTVTNTNDSGAGSLRQAMLDANTAGGTNTITISACCQVNLASALPAITNNLTISGSNPRNFIIRRLDSAPEFRIFTIQSGVTVNISGVTVTNGKLSGLDPSISVGSGIYNNGTLHLDNVQVLNNTTTDANGGGVHTESTGTTTINNSLISGNIAAYGGGLYNNSGSLTVTNSTIANNTATVFSSGVHNWGTTTIANSTIWGNTGLWAMQASGGSITVYNSTIANNNGIGVGSNITLGNTIVSGNNGGNFQGGFTSLGHNLISDNSGSGFAGSDLRNTNPLLGVLGENGSQFVQTMLLRHNSPAIDGGDDTICANSFVANKDERGATRPKGAHCDIGAVESSNIVVTNTNLAGAGSLSQAITDANAAPGLDDIVFDIPGPGPYILSFTFAQSDVPLITDQLVLDGSTQVANPTTPLIELHKNGFGGAGLHLAAGSSGSTIRGFVIYGAVIGAINIANSDNNIIQDNYLGTNLAGNAAGSFPNPNGVVIIAPSTNNLIGVGAFGVPGNLISGNLGYGIAFDGTSVSSNYIIGNRIGTDATGTAPVPNGVQGIRLTNGTHDNKIGPNGDGINDNLERNIISGNGGDGIYISDAGTNNNLITGNYIGTNAAGNGAIANANNGVTIQNGAQNNIVGLVGFTPNPASKRNIISGNGGVGVLIFNPNTNNNIVAGNYIGTNATGDAAISNVHQGIGINDSAKNNIIGTNSDGDGDALEGNLISGNGVSNTSSGIDVSSSGTTNNVIAGNRIGTNAAGTAGIPNSANGIHILLGAQNNTVGGTGPNSGNLIAYNAWSGVQIGLTSSDTTTTGNRITHNSIFANNHLDIDLGGDGVTPNDAGDGDIGPNNLQNFPVLTGATPLPNGVSINGTLNSTPISSFTLEFFYSSSCATPQGQTFLGSTGTNTDGSGNTSFNFTSSSGPIPLGSFLTATATDANGNTSEFSACFQLTSPAANNVWSGATPIALTTSSANLRTGTQSLILNQPNQAAWFKFTPGIKSRLHIKVTGTGGGPLPANFDVTLHYDIQGMYDSLKTPQTLSTLQSLDAASLHLGDVHLGDVHLGDVHLGDVHLGDVHLGDVHLGDVSYTVNSTIVQDLVSKLLPYSNITPPGYVSQAFAAAPFYTLRGLSAFEGTTPEALDLDVWNEPGDFYIQVRGRDGSAVSPTAFQISIEAEGGICLNLPPVTGSVFTPVAEAGKQYQTLILTDYGRLKGDTSNLLKNLDLFKVHPNVNGLVVDLNKPEFARIKSANATADANLDCPYAKNQVAAEIKSVIDAYRKIYPVKYIVLLGPDDVIPFMRYPDLAEKATELDYHPQVKATGSLYAATQNGMLLSQDGYGSSSEVADKVYNFPVPGLPVGRLVETAPQINTVIAAFLATNGVLTPKSSLVTGYDLVADVAKEVQSQLAQGIPNSPPTSLISDSWTANDLKAQLVDQRKDMIFLSGHFNEGLLYAAITNTTLLASQLDQSSVDHTNSLIIDLGCHSGYNVLDSEGLTGVTPDPQFDWPQVFARQGMTAIGGTGYQYADTEKLAYSEQLYLDFVKQLHTRPQPGSDNTTVPIGDALWKAKQHYIASLPTPLGGVDEKIVLVSTLYGLPMMQVTMAGIDPSSGDVTPIKAMPTPLGNGLSSYDYKHDYTTEQHTVTINQPDASPVNTFYYSGKSGVSTNAPDPVLPLELGDATVPGQVLRGVGFIGGTYTDQPNLLPLVSNLSTDTSQGRTTFGSVNFYPSQFWKINFFDSLANSDGQTRLVALPAQYRSNLDSTTGKLQQNGTFRVYSNMNLRMFYSTTTGVAAVVAPPTINSLKAEDNGSNSINFTVQVSGDDTAGIQGVWITYTADKSGNSWYGTWASLYLTRQSSTSNIWTGQLPEGSNRLEDIRFMVQAVNGVGVVTLATNSGAYFTPSPYNPPPPAQTNLSLQISFPSGAYSDTPLLTATLNYSDTNNVLHPLANQIVTFELNGQFTQAKTNASGQALINNDTNNTFTIHQLPGSYNVVATFQGAPGYLSSQTSTPLQVVKRNTSLDLVSAFGTGGNQIYLATLKDTSNGGIPLVEKPVFFVGTSGGVSYAASSRTNAQGQAVLSLPNWPAGVYQLCAYFADKVPTQFGQIAENNYNGSLICPNGVTVTVPKAIPAIIWNDPADITAGTPLGPNQLNATAYLNGTVIPGTFFYAPPAGTLLGVGQKQTLSVNFVPNDTNKYDNAARSVSINVIYPKPLITSLSPAVVNAGGSDFTLIVYGTGFSPSSKIRWNGTDRVTTYVNSTELRTQVSAAEIATPNNIAITVFTPAPGGGTSDPVTLAIKTLRTPVTVATLSTPANTNGWHKNNLTVTLKATDNSGTGIKEITYSASPDPAKGGQTIPSNTVSGDTATIVINTEGITTLSFFARDNAGGVEDPAKTLVIRLDKSAPEFDLYFDSNTRVLKLKTVDGLSGPATLPISLPGNSNENPAPYVLQDQAGNTLTVKFRRITSSLRDTFAGVEFQKLEYNSVNNSKVLDLNSPWLDNSFKVEFSQEAGRPLTQAQQSFQLAKAFNVTANFRSKPNTTAISIKEQGKPEVKRTDNGLSILHAVSNNGKLEYHLGE